MNKSYSKIRHIQESNQRLEKRILKEQGDNSPNPFLDDRVNDFVSEGYKIVPKFDLPDGVYNLGGSGSVCYIMKDGKDTGYVYVTTGAIRGDWGKHTVEIVNGQIKELLFGKVYKILFNESEVEK
jgi:hypothetical protein